MRNFNIFIFISLVCVFTSCKEFLEEKPNSFLSPENFYQSQADAESALVGAYDALGTGSGSYYARPLAYLTLFCSDEALPPRLASERQLNDFTFSADNGRVSGLWSNIYDAISRANIVIERVADIDMDQDLKNQIIAEAKFLRGLHYFNGVRLWGGIPLVTEEVTSLDQVEIPRSSVAEVYDQIIEDLTTASSVLPATNQAGRASKAAAKGILAKVYLTRATSEASSSSDFQMCADLAEEVMNMSEYELLPNYQDAIGAEDEFNKESLFEWQGDRILSPLGEHSIYGQFTLPIDIFGYIPENATGNSDLVSEVEYFNLYPDNDYRKESTFLTEGLNKDGQLLNWTEFTYPFPHPAWKFVNQAATTRSGYAFSGNFPILRLSDVYLMRAEALNEINGPTAEAYEAINAIRERARNRDGISTSEFPKNLEGLTKEEFREAVQLERAIELGFEGHRWFDLVRTNKLLETIKSIHPEYPISDKNYLFPIPADELILNEKLSQNPGW